MLSIIRSIIFARRHGLLRLRKASSNVALECIGGQCGLCCSVMGKTILVDSQDEDRIPAEEIITKNDLKFLRSNGQVCACLENRACRIYNVRPKGCREYPWYNINGVLYYDKGCPGIKLVSGSQPEVENMQSIVKYLPFGKVLQKGIILLFKIW